MSFKDSLERERIVGIHINLQESLRKFLSLYTDLPKESIENTPRRLVQALIEMTSGYNSSPEEILGKVFEVECDELIICKSISFTSVCSHHLLPFYGTCDVGYIPGKVVGLSKLARLVDCYSRRLQMQETMTQQISKAIETHLEARGVAVVTKAQHSCMCARGVRKEGAEMICSSMLGVFRTESAARAEFLNLCRN